ncbi:hypothetical protein [Rikenella microfusus]|uniref:hypothetical protein n=1 Tax=Rikenella microfusus TaxID=28139 RepID=UPI00248E0F85|nr:hypothetical protein [Rikenella microfusus]
MLTVFKISIQQGFYLRGFIVAFAVDKGIADDTAVAVGLQGALGNMKRKADFMPVHSLFAVGRVDSVGQMFYALGKSLGKADKVQSCRFFDFDVHGRNGFRLNMATKKHGYFVSCNTVSAEVHV